MKVFKKAINNLNPKMFRLKTISFYLQNKQNDTNR